VELDAGGELVITQQNVESTSMDVLAARDRRVRLVWHRLHNRPVETTG